MSTSNGPPKDQSYSNLSVRNILTANQLTANSTVSGNVQTGGVNATNVDATNIDASTIQADTITVNRLNANIIFDIGTVPFETLPGWTVTASNAMFARNRFTVVNLLFKLEADSSVTFAAGYNDALTIAPEFVPNVDVGSPMIAVFPIAMADIIFVGFVRTTGVVSIYNPTGAPVSGPLESEVQFIYLLNNGL
jgi:hypothetical protein